MWKNVHFVLFCCLRQQSKAFLGRGLVCGSAVEKSGSSWYVVSSSMKTTMSLFHTAEDLLIIYDTEAKQWATYLQSVFTGPISEARICCYDIATASSRTGDFQSLVQYTCKLLILSKGLLQGLCPVKRAFLTRVLNPAARVVVLLCGVESLAPLLELVPLNGHECTQISSEQDPSEYLSTVTDILGKGMCFIFVLLCKSLTVHCVHSVLSSAW